MSADRMNDSLGRIENLEFQIEKLAAISRDGSFTAYLGKLRERLLGQKYQVELLQDELEKSYKMYANRMQIAGYQVPESLEAVIEQALKKQSEALAERKPEAMTAEVPKVLQGLGAMTAEVPEVLQEPEAMTAEVPETSAEPAPETSEMKIRTETVQAEQELGAMTIEVPEASAEPAPEVSEMKIRMETVQPEQVQETEIRTETAQAEQVQETEIRTETVQAEQEPEAVTAKVRQVSAEPVPETSEMNIQTQTPPVVQPAPVKYVSWNMPADVPYNSGQARFSGASPVFPTGAVPPRPEKKKNNNTEFIIGATLLSIIGAAFILTALVMFGINYMNGFTKGICQYAVCLAVMLISELWVYRRLPKLGSVLSSIGIGGFYLATALNYMILHIFNLWVTLGIASAITIAVVLLSRKRDSSLYRIIGMIAGYLCFLMIRNNITDAEFLVASGTILLLNILFIVLPVCRYRTGINVFHMIVNTAFFLGFIGRSVYCGVPQKIIFIFAVSSTAVLQLILISQLLYNKKMAEDPQRAGRAVSSAGILTTYGISVFFYVIRINRLVNQMILDSRELDAALHIPNAAAAALGVVGLAALLFLCIRKCPGKWAVYYYLNIMIFAVYLEAEDVFLGNVLLMHVVMLVMLVISKVLCLKKIRQLRVSDAVITFAVCMLAALDMDADVLLIGVVFSIICLSQWQTYHELLLTAALCSYIESKVPASLQLPAAAGILLAGILAFNNVKRWKGNHIMLYNSFALAGQAACLAALSNPVYRNAYVTYFCMLIFGLATIIITFQENYGMNFRWKNMILAVFLTYMAFVFRTNEPIVNSILIIVIALICVGVGFRKKQKEMRIYGLVISLLVCAKMVLYDFLGTPTLQKTILFFVVGMIALIIAGIYIILEKKNSESR